MLEPTKLQTIAGFCAVGFYLIEVWGAHINKSEHPFLLALIPTAIYVIYVALVCVWYSSVLTS